VGNKPLKDAGMHKKNVIAYQGGPQKTIAQGRHCIDQAEIVGMSQSSWCEWWDWWGMLMGQRDPTRCMY
jgi:hypothetical protein